jgi:hypothetical protein
MYRTAIHIFQGFRGRISVKVIPVALFTGLQIVTEGLSCSACIGHAVRRRGKPPKLRLQAGASNNFVRFWKHDRRGAMGRRHGPLLNCR